MTDSDTPRTILHLIKEGENTLCGNDVPRMEAEMLLAHTLGKERSYLRAWPEQVVPPEHMNQYRHHLGRRRQGHPIAYLTGRQEFWSLELAVNEHTLIPRPETELLVEHALENIPLDQHLDIADLGTGSGAIALAIAKERPRCRIHASDVSQDTLTVAENNARRHQLNNVRFYQGHWFDAFDQQRFHMVLSNPPYIAEHDVHLTQGDLRYEPRTALTCGLSGLEAIIQIVKSAKLFMHPNAWLYLEHGYQQADEIRKILIDQSYAAVKTLRDLNRHERVTQAQNVVKST